MLKGINPLLTPELLKLLCEMGRLNERMAMRAGVAWKRTECLKYCV